MKLLNGFVFLSLALASLPASAHRPIYVDPSDCLQQIVTPVKHTTRVTAKCLMSQPLATSWTRKVFPGLDAHEYPVEYYKGAFETHKQTTTVYATRIYDACNGGKFISISYDTQTDDDVETFSVRNPNLDDSVSATFQLVRMTRDEAKAEMLYQHQLCLSTP